MKRALWTLAVLLSHWRRHPMQLATLLIGLISATALWSGVQALNQQVIPELALQMGRPVRSGGEFRGVEERIRATGAVVDSGEKYKVRVVEDGENVEDGEDGWLLTGQNAGSVGALTEALLARLGPPAA